MHSVLLENYLSNLKELSENHPVLDLACGSGRNGLYLINQNIPVEFADINENALKQISELLNESDIGSKSRSLAKYWQVDFEPCSSKLNDSINSSSPSPLENKQYSSILVFKYLHRQLFEEIKTAIVPGGLIIYETFTTKQATLGRPKNPDFLLREGELLEVFNGWEILHSFEGVVTKNNGEGHQAIAQIVAVKP